MKEEQRRVVIAAAIVIAIMLIFPPFKGRMFEYATNEGYSFIGAPPTSLSNINVGQLLVQWIGVAAVAGIVYWVIGSKPDDE